MAATVDSAAATPANPQEPVPLDTIPISPEGNMENGTNDGSANGASADETVTVFHDPNNFNVKHPLMNAWTLWFTKPPSGKVGAILKTLLNGRKPLTCVTGRQLERAAEGGYFL